MTTNTATTGAQDRADALREYLRQGLLSLNGQTFYLAADGWHKLTDLGYTRADVKAQINALLATGEVEVDAHPLGPTLRLVERPANESGS